MVKKGSKRYTISFDKKDVEIFFALKENIERELGRSLSKSEVISYAVNYMLFDYCFKSSKIL